MEDNNNMTLPLEEADNNITESPVSSEIGRAHV